MKRIISLLVVASFLLGLFSVPALAENTYSGEVYVSELMFFNEDGVKINTPEGAEKIHAEAYAKAMDEGEVEYAFSILAYCEGKLVAAETNLGTIRSQVTFIETPEISVNNESDAELEIKVMLTTPDFSTLLASEGNMKSESAEITDIYLGDYKLELAEGVYEYDVVRYLPADKASPAVRVYAEDLSADISVYEEGEGNTVKYTIYANAASGTASVCYTVNATIYIVDETSLVAIEADGKMLEGFDPKIKEYTIDLKEGSSLPELKAYAYDKDSVISINSPADASGEFEITVTKGEKSSVYTVKIRTVYEKTLTENTRYTHADHYVTARAAENITARTTHVPLQAKSGANDWVGYTQFPASELKDVEFVDEAVFSGKATDSAEYRFFISTHENAKTNDKFAEINNNLADPIGSANLVKNQIHDFVFDAKKLRVTSEGYIVICLSLGYNPNNTNFVLFKEFSLKVKYVTEQADNLLIKSENTFDPSILEDGGEEAPPSVGTPSLTVSKSWENNGDKTELKINITAENLAPGSRALVKALRPEKTEEEEASTYEKYAWLTEITSDEEGKASEEFIFSDVSGEYTFIVDSCEETVYIPSALVVNSLIDGLSEGSFDDNGLKELLDGNLKDLAIEEALYAGLVPEGRKSVCKYIIENIEEITIDGFNSILSDATGIKGITSGESPENIEKCLEERIILDVISQNENYSDYTSLSDRTALMTAIKEEEYNTPEEVEEALFSALMVIKVKDISSYSEITDILSDYKDYVSCYDKYENLSTGNNIKVNKYLTDKLDSIDNPEELNSAIEKGIESVNKPAQQPSRPSGGGGGGRGSLSLGETITPNPVIEEAKLPFADVPENFWGYNAIKKLYFKNIISGKSSSQFCPGDRITRAEFAKLITESAGLKGDRITLTFTDVPEKGWYYSYIKAAVENGIILGKSEEIFAPDEYITRQDAAVMISRIFKENQEITNQKFSDDGEISDYAKDAVYILRNKGIINGANGRFNPLNNLTRAEAAQIISNLLNEIK